MEEHHLCVMGAGGVGKSAVTARFVSGDFQETYDPTIEDSFRRDFMIDGTSSLLEIIDTAGQEDFKVMQDNWLRTGKGFLFVYSITEPASIAEVKSLTERLVRVQECELSEIPIVLVGNKSDMISERKVTEAEGKALATELACPFFEASAKNDHNIQESFFELVRQSRKKNAAKDEKKKDKDKKKPGFCIIL